MRGTERRADGSNLRHYVEEGAETTPCERHVAVDTLDKTLILRDDADVCKECEQAEASANA